MHRWLFILLGLLPVQVIALQSGDFTYEETSSNTVEITDYGGAGGDVVIPSTIESKNVTSSRTRPNKHGKILPIGHSIVAVD